MLSDQTMAVLNTTADIIFCLIVVLGIIFHKKDKAQAIQAALQGVGDAVRAVEPLVEGTTIGRTLHIIDEIERAAEKGVKAAEQLFSNDPTVDKKKIATDYVHTVIAELGFALSDRVIAIIDATIEAAYYSFKAWGKPSASDADPKTGGQTPVSNPAPSEPTVSTESAPVAAPATDA